MSKVREVDDLPVDRFFGQPQAHLVPRGARMIKWHKNPRVARVALFLGAIAAFAIGSGAGTRWY